VRVKPESRVLVLYAGRAVTIAIVLRKGMVDTLSVYPLQPPGETARRLAEEAFLKEVRSVALGSQDPQWAEEMERIMGPRILLRGRWGEGVEEAFNLARDIDRESLRLLEERPLLD